MNPNPASPPHIRLQAWAWLALIVLSAAILRFTQLGIAPAGGHGDVAWIGINALDWLDRGAFPYYVWHLYAPEPLVVQLNALSIPLFGASYLSPRMVTAVFGLLLVIVLFPATWWLLDGHEPRYRERAALLASLAAALSLHAAYISRLGMRAALFPALVGLVVWLTAWAWRKGGYIRWGLAGTALALMQYAYIPARLFPLVLALWFLHGWWADRPRWKERWRGWVVMAAVSFILTLPNLITFVATPEAFTARADSGGADTGGWAWQYDPEGGIGSVMLQKIGLELLAFGIRWQGPYSVMGQPMLGAVFFIGFLIAIALLFTRPKQIALAWAAIGIPIMFLTDLISGAVVEIHAVRQTGVLPFVYILAGVGLAQGIHWLENHFNQREMTLSHRLLMPILLLMAFVPAGVGLWMYLRVEIPAEYADPETGWRDQQIDVDIGNRILAQPDTAYLLPYDEYTRSNIAWLTMDAFRQRGSGINGDGVLDIPSPPDELTIITTSDPYRIRHDGRESQWDTRLWVLLHDGATYLLPPLTDTQESTILDQLASVDGEPLIDRSGTEIAQFTAIETPADLFRARDVLDYEVDAMFSVDDTPEAQLLGYSIDSDDAPLPELNAGETIYITLYWRTEHDLIGDYEVFAQIWDETGAVIGAAHDYPFSGMYRTRLWRSAEVVASHHWLTLPDELPIGRYQLVAGLYQILENEPLIVSGENAAPDGRAMIAPDLRVSPLPAEIGAAPPQSLQLGELFSLASLDAQVDESNFTLSDEMWEVQAGDTLTLNLVWEVDSRPPLDYSLFLHLLDDSSAPPITQADMPLGNGSLPSGVWGAGDRIADTVTLTLPEGIAPGTYSLWMGSYYYADGSRLEPVLADEAQPNGRVRLVKIVVR